MRTAKLAMVALAVAAMCSTASADNWGISGTSYENSTGGTVYVLDHPTSWAVIGGFPPTQTLVGAGPNGADAYYREGWAGSDDSTQAYWDFTGAPLPDVGTNLIPGEYKAQVYVSDYAGLPHENDGVFGSANGPWGWHAMGNFSSWNGVSQATPGWTDLSNWVGGYVWLSNNGWGNGIWTDMTVSVKWNPWGGYGGLAVSGVRISTDGNFEPAPVTLGLDIKPDDCPNGFRVNMKSNGRIPMAILGSATFDVSTINVDSISIGGVAFPVKAPSIEDVSAPAGEEECACQIGTDGYPDLVLHFSQRDIIAALGLDEMEPGTVVTVTVEGSLADGMAFVASDCITLVGPAD